MRSAYFIVVCSIAACNMLAAQDVHRKVAAERLPSKVVIDGVLNDSAWQVSPSFTGFKEWRPSFEREEEPGAHTEAWLYYNNEGIYLAGYCHEKSRDSISTELVGRDKIGINDYIGILFDTYHDKLNGFGYYVTPLGEQFDAKYSAGNEDESWNSVYTTATRIVADGWTFEMFIPYSAIRFSKKDIQNWGVNITRRRQKRGRQYMWNPINPNVNGLLNQFGVWEGLQNIKPPVRLSFSPYLAAYTDNNQKQAAGSRWSNSVNGGMDVKYGINNAFTLDMTLIPDFGQVQSDNQVLNLTPFEVKFNENRTFFTEGTELFNKGNFFYSRRIGGQPLHYWDVQSQLQNGQTLVENPAETRLLNATKVSGRTASGLGIGVFNAITRPQYAVIEEGSTKNRLSIETSPLTNYSVVVLDQTMKHNSSVSFVNTNVMRSGSDYDANVSAVLWDVYDKNINWNVWGKAAVSQLFGYQQPGKAYTGYHYNVGAGKFKGPFNFNIVQRFASTRYQQNDLGYFNNANFLDHSTWIGYKWVKPKGFYNNLYFNLNGFYSRRHQPSNYQSFSISSNLNGQLKNLWEAGIIADYKPNAYDFYEPRIGNAQFKRPWSFMAGFWLYSNRAKKYSMGLEYYNRYVPRFSNNNFDVSFNNQYRFNNKLTIGLTNFVSIYHHNVGFAMVAAADTSVFGRRNRHTVENVADIKYNFTNKMGLTLRARHYWSKVDYNRYYRLLSDGNLEQYATTRSANNNVNFFNVDMVYTWQFAPGSFLNISWKNATEHFNQHVHQPYFENLFNTLAAPQRNTLSLKVIYFLDYLSLSKKHHS